MDKGLSSHLASFTEHKQTHSQNCETAQMPKEAEPCDCHAALTQDCTEQLIYIEMLTSQSVSNIKWRILSILIKHRICALQLTRSPYLYATDKTKMQVCSWSCDLIGRNVAKSVLNKKVHNRAALIDCKQSVKHRPAKHYHCQYNSIFIMSDLARCSQSDSLCTKNSRVVWRLLFESSNYTAPLVTSCQKF